MPFLRVVVGSSLIAASLICSCALGATELQSQSTGSNAGVDLASSISRITGPIEVVETERFTLPPACVLAQLPSYKTRTVLDTLAIFDEPRAEQPKQVSAAPETPASPVVQAASPAETTPIVLLSSASEGSLRFASAGSAPQTMSAIGATTLAVLGAAAAILSLYRKQTAR